MLGDGHDPHIPIDVTIKALGKKIIYYLISLKNPRGKIGFKNTFLNNLCASLTDLALFQPTPRPFFSKFHLSITLKVSENIMGTSGNASNRYFLLFP